jgi:hypothetical protein
VRRPTLLALGAVSLVLAATGWSEDRLVRDRAAIEHVYYAHRLGTKPPFDEAMPPALLEKMVRLERKKEAVLARVYKVEITPAMVAAEVQRIDATTRAPEVLAELKHALGDDPERFAGSIARPNVVERELRSRFENDDALHLPQRRESEAARTALLAAHTQGTDPAKLLALLKQTGAGTVTETTWQLGARPEEKAATEAGADDAAIKQRFGSHAQLLSPPQPGADRDRTFYFADLPDELQNVLRAQLRQPGDVSAVIETPGGFLLFLAKEKTDTILSAASLSVAKRSYEEWMAAQPDAP